MKKTNQKKLSAFIIAAMLFSVSAYSQIVYTDVNPDTTVITNNAIYNLDLNNDGIIDFRIRKESYYWCPFMLGASSTTYSDIEIDALNGSEVSNDSNNYPKKINYNNVIKSGSTNWMSAASQLLAKKSNKVTKGRFQCFTSPTTTYTGNWNAANDRYVGLRLIIGVNKYYGWVRLNVANGGTSVTVKDYAFDSTPNHSIHAGSTSGARMTNPTANNFTPVLPSPVFQTYKTDASGLQLLNESQKSKMRKHENELNEEKKRHPQNIKNNFPDNSDVDREDDVYERNSSSTCPPNKQMGFNGNRLTPFYLLPVGYYASECNIAISNAGKIVSISNGWIYYFDETGALLFSDSIQHFCSGLIDVHVTYDKKQDRFIFCSGWGYSDDTTFVGFGIVTGFSVSNNPLDGWNFYYIPNSAFNDNNDMDFPLIAISDDEVFITTLRTDSNGNIVSSAIMQMDKNAGYAGASSITTQIFHTPLSATTGGTVVPAQGGSQTYGPNMYFVVANEGSVSDLFYVQEITNTIASGQAVLNTYGPVQSNKTYRPPGDIFQKNNLPLLAISGAFILSTFYENGILQFAQNTKVNGKASVYLGRISGIPNNLSCVAKKISDSNRYLSFPSIAYAGNSNTDNSAIVGYEYSASNQFPGLSAVYVNSNFKISNPIDVKHGNDTINGIWGDYSGICRRYNHPGEVWMEGQYGSNVFPNINWIAKLHVSSCCNLRTSNEEISETKHADETNNLAVYPNPLSNSTTISFSLSLPMAIGTEKVSLKIFDVNGRLVKTLADGEMQEGNHRIEWNATNEKGDVVDAGIYFLKFDTENYSETKKLSVVK